MEAILYIFLSLCILGFVRMMTVFFHELAHALLAVYYTKNAMVEVFVGSTGERKEGFTWKWGRRLQFYLQFAPWKLSGGLCKYSAKGITWQQEIRILVVGGATSLLIMIIASVILKYNSWGFGNLLGNFILLSALIDLFCSLVPRKKPFKLYDGTTQLNDIDQIKKILENNNIKFPKSIPVPPQNKKEVGREDKVRKHRRPKQLPTVKGNRASDN
jgi:hypothetical protein